MKMIKRFLSSAVVLTASVLGMSPAAVQACAPVIQPNYIQHKGNAYYPVLETDNALNYFIETSGDLFRGVPIYKNGVTTPEAELKDFAVAIKKHCSKIPESDQKKLLDSYIRFCEEFSVRTTSVAKGFPVIPAELEEFRLYHQGREELDKAPNAFPASWTKLLSLPPDRRHYRTTWVLYLRGNLDKANIHAHAAAVRKAIDEGFADTPGLGWGSYKQELKFGGDPVKVIRAAVHAQRGAMDHCMIKFLRYYNPKFSCPGQLFANLSESEYYQLLSDPISREILVIYENNIQRLLNRGASYKFRCIDILAFRAWNNCLFKEAKAFLAMQKKPTLLSLYVEAELARYYGNIDLSARKLRQWLKMAENVTPVTNQKIIRRGSNINSPYFAEAELWRSEIYGILGYTMVLKRDFMNAARFFYESGQGEADLPYIAERFLSLDQLMEFTDSISSEADKANNEYCSKPYMARMMRHLTARRAFREGRFDVAKKYMPDAYKGYLDQYLSFLAVGRDEKRDKDERGLALYNAAKILRYRGMELRGTETVPDNYRFKGNYGNPNTRLSQKCVFCIYDKNLGAWKFCSEHNAFETWKPGFNAVKNYLTVPSHQRWHYRYLAAELALEAGNIAKDQDLLALINLFGGEIFRQRSPREADVFYKRLVNQSRKTKIGKIADEIRWFPYDVVPLRREIRSVDPIESLDAVKKLMREAFPEKKSEAKN